MSFHPVSILRHVMVMALLWAPPAAAASPEEARVLMLSLEREAVVLAAPGLSDFERERRFRQVVRRDFDMPGVARFVLGRHWRTASPGQREEFLRLFEDLTVETWARRFRDYAGERLDILAIRPAEGGFLVDSLIQRPGQRPIPVSWRLVDAGRLAVADIVVEGVSMAITYRSEYASVLRTAGGFDGLLGTMRRQLAQGR